jgi:hypothetical protein
MASTAPPPQLADRAPPPQAPIVFPIVSTGVVVAPPLVIPAAVSALFSAAGDGDGDAAGAGGGRADA